MKEEFKTILNCMLLSDKICEGEYYCIHSDYIHDLKEAIEHYFGEDSEIEKLVKSYFLDNKSFEEVDSDICFVIDKINELIDEVNKLKEDKK